MIPISRRTARYLAAALAGAIATIYFLIGAGVITVVMPAENDGSMVAFGISAGAAFLVGAMLLLSFDRRLLWILGATLQLLVVWGYFAVAPDRTPAFESWGISLRVIQVPLFAALVYLAVGSADNRARAYNARMKGADRHEDPRHLRDHERQYQNDR